MPVSPRVLVTGANGFIGQAVCRRLASAGLAVKAALRQPPQAGLPEGVTPVAMSDLTKIAALEPVVRDVDVVVHLAAKVHALGAEAHNSEAFRAVNVDGSVALAEAAAEAGVQRFVFVSTIGVHAVSDTPLTEDSPIWPESCYAKSKWLAERTLAEVCRKRSLELVIIRPPMVYGPHCPGNMARLAALVRRGLPLPLGAVNNHRSFIHFDNLSEVFLRSVRETKAANETFLCRDGLDVSTRQTLVWLGEGMGRSARLLGVQPVVLHLAARMIGLSGEVSKLTDNLQVDDSKCVRYLGFRPVIGPVEGIRETGRSFA